MKSKKIILIFFIFLLIIISLYPIGFALSKYGSRGNEVREIQTKLKNWGYYNGNIDGIYGSKTFEAVKKFQRKNGLTVDGIVGEKTLKALGINSSKNEYSSSSNNTDLNLLSKLVFAEARGEPYKGMVAVAATVLNRVADSRFPNTIAGVIYQPGAFSCLYDGQVNAAVSDSAYKAAREAVNGSDPSGGAIYYYNPVKSTNKWIFSRPVITVIGAHRFCS